jgi:hypothetical protein
MRSVGTMVVGLALFGVSAAVAQAGPCIAPRELAGWGQRHGVSAAAHIGGNPVSDLSVGEAVDLALRPIDKVAVIAPLGKGPGPDDRGGIVTFRAALSGTYRVALGGQAWIDVAQGQTPLASVAHAPGPACMGIAKMVDFRLEAGSYILQITAAQSDTIPVMIARLP